MKVIDFFKLAMNMTAAGQCKFGQVIYEFNPVGNMEWVHFGNDPTTFFSIPICQMLGRSKFLRSLDGGKTYQIVIA
jgi:hypothetical protein